MSSQTFALPSPFAAPSSLLARLTRLAPGLLIAGLVALAAMGGARVSWLQAHGISSLTVAIVLGMVVGNVVPGVAGAPGVGFSKQQLLRWGIVLYGMRLTFTDVAHVGVAGIAIDATVLASTFLLANWLGTRVFKMDRTTAMLIGAGSSICGAAAVMATDPVVRGKPEQVTVAVSTVVVFGTLAIFLYPALWHIPAVHALFSAHEYGVWVGSTVHEVAQVVAAGRDAGAAAGDTAVIAKLVRVMMLAPFLLILSAWLSRRQPVRGAQGARITVPWFAFGFVAMAGFNSLDLLPHQVVAQITLLDTLLLTVAMAGLGLTTHVRAIRVAGLKPLALAAVLFAWLIFAGGAINLGFQHLLG